MFCLVGCGTNNEKYDVTIKITNNFGEEWIFTPDVSELTYEFEYIGEEMYFYVDSYNLSEHPRWSEKWFAPSNEGADVFDSSYGKVNQRCDIIKLSRQGGKLYEEKSIDFNVINFCFLNSWL